MCRFFAYTGSPIIADELLYKPDNSLIKQSYDAREMEEPLNGDGFGMGWYVNKISSHPGIFNSVQPAWNNKNLRSISPLIESGCLFAHVRAASSGHITKLNCHPFCYKNLMMMHNGEVEEFEEIKRPLTEKLTNERFHWIDGQTDSQHLFALMLDHLYENNDSPEPQDYIDALCKTFDDLEKLKDGYGLHQPSFLNFMITDGDNIIGCRYVTDSDIKPHSLYHSEGARYECSEGTCRMNTDCPEHEKAVLIVSEKLNDNDNEWHQVPENHLLTVDNKLNIDFESI